MFSRWMVGWSAWWKSPTSCQNLTCHRLRSSTAVWWSSFWSTLPPTRTETCSVVTCGSRGSLTSSLVVRWEAYWVIPKSRYSFYVRWPVSSPKFVLNSIWRRWELWIDIGGFVICVMFALMLCLYVLSCFLCFTAARRWSYRSSGSHK